MLTLQKPHTVKVNYTLDKVTLQNLLVSDRLEFIAFIEPEIQDINIQRLSVMEKGEYIILRSLLRKLQRSIYGITNNVSLTIPEAIVLWNKFKFEIYQGKQIHYTAVLIHQKLS